MASTYLDLVNQVLIQLNEVTLTESTFNNARGIHAAVKGAVKFSVRKINTQKFEWPFNASTKTEVLTKGQVSYNWPSDFKKPDWESFQLQKDDTLLINSTQLKHIKRDEYYHYFKDLDDDQGVNGRGVPAMVFEGHGTTFGITPSPDAAYTIVYKYWSNPTELVEYSDTVTIPSEYDYVIVLGALYHLKSFKNDMDGYQVSKAEFDAGIKDMIGVFLSTDDHMSDTRIPGAY